MTVRIIIYLVLLALGGVLSYKKIIGEKMYTQASKLQFIFVIFLVFIMGLRIGMNDEILKSFMKIGFKATVIVIFVIVFSIIFVYLGRKMLLKDFFTPAKEVDNSDN